MSDLYRNAMDAISRARLEKLSDYARDNPSYNKGMWIDFYGEEVVSGEREYIGCGVIVEPHWNERTKRHYYTIRMFDDGHIYKLVSPRNLMRVHFSPRQSRQFKKMYAVHGGFKNGE